MVTLVRAPDPLPLTAMMMRPGVFLAGACGAVDWRASVEQELTRQLLDCIVLNPLRTDWADLQPATGDNPKFVVQKRWELTALKHCAVAAFCFPPDTLAAVSMFELGAVIATGKRLVLYCPETYCHRGDVAVAVRDWGIRARTTTSMDDFTETIVQAVRVLNEISRGRNTRELAALFCGKDL